MSDRHHLAALLAWYRDMGVDALPGSEPVDWRGQKVDKDEKFGARLPDRARQTDSPAPLPERKVLERVVPERKVKTSLDRPLAEHGTRPALRSPASPSIPFTRSYAESAPPHGLAITAQTLADLEHMVRAFDGCALKKTAKNTCFYRGAEKARVVVVGEAPGREEDLEGKPFVGPAGRLLDKMLAAIGLGPETVHILNTVYWRPPGNRVPTPQETWACRPFLERQIALVGPDVLVLLGGTATKAMLETAEGITKIRGVWRPCKVGETTYPALATLHPAYLLRTPLAKRLAWRDWLMVKHALAGEST